MLLLSFLISFGLWAKPIHRRAPRLPRTPYPMIADMNVGETVEFRFERRGTLHKLKLIDFKEEKDEFRGAVRSAKLNVEVNGEAFPVFCENYTLSKYIKEHRIQVECMATRGLVDTGKENAWSLSKDVRIRISPYYFYHFAIGEFVYPLENPLFTGETQLGNEPVFVNGGEDIEDKKIYYHHGVDIGGMEGVEKVVSTTAGRVIEAKNDFVIIADKRDWHHGYYHLKSIDKKITKGKKVKAGDFLGLLGKEGDSGGWAHLHYEVEAKLPNGKRGSINAFPFLWEASKRQFKTRLTAVARPHHIAKMGEEVFIHAWFSDTVLRELKTYEWFFTDEDGDQETKTGVEVKHRFKTAGTHIVMLKVEDLKGRIDYDFMKVQVVDPEKPLLKYPTLHAAFKKEENNKVAFKVRVFNAGAGTLKVDYGDNESEKRVLTKEEIEAGYLDFNHTYKKAGKYLVRFDYEKSGRTLLEVDIPEPLMISYQTMPAGLPHKGKLHNAKNLSELLNKHPNKIVTLSPAEFQYASDQMLEMIEGAAQWNTEGPICVGDISRRKGGKIARHALHQRGLDVDIAYIPEKSELSGLLRHRQHKFHNKFADNFICKDGVTENLALEKNVRLFAYLTRRFDIKAIWVHREINNAMKSHQYKTVSDEDLKLVFNTLHEDDLHYDHFHVRLWCPEGATDCYD